MELSVQSFDRLSGSDVQLKHPRYHDKIYYGCLYVEDSVVTFIENVTLIEVKVAIQPGVDFHADDALIKMLSLIHI